MTTDESIKKTEELPIEIKKFLSNAIGNKMIFPNAKTVIDDIGIHYLLDEKSRELTSSISSKLLVAKFAIDFLKVLNNIIKKRYNIQLTSEDFKDIDRIDKIKNRVAELRNETVIDWEINECLEKLKDIIDNIGVDNIDKLVTLGNIISLTEKELLYVADKEDIEIYDILYRYINRLANLKIPKSISINFALSIKTEKIEFETEGRKYKYNCEEKSCTLEVL